MLSLEETTWLNFWPKRGKFEVSEGFCQQPLKKAPQWSRPRFTERDLRMEVSDNTPWPFGNGIFFMQYVQKFRQWPYLSPFWSAPRFVSPSLCVWGSSPIPAPWFSCSGEIETPCSTGYSRFSQSQTWQSTYAVECFGVCQGKIQRAIYGMLEASLEAGPSVKSLQILSNDSLIIRRCLISLSHLQIMRKLYWVEHLSQTNFPNHPCSHTHLSYGCNDVQLLHRRHGIRKICQV